MPSYRYAISVSLKEEDYRVMKILQNEKNVKVVDMFRRGLEAYAAQFSIADYVEKTV